MFLRKAEEKKLCSALPSGPICLLQSVLHRLQVVGLLDLGLALLPHGLTELLALFRGDEVGGDVTVLLTGQVDGLVLQGYLGRQGLEVALGEELSLELSLTLGG